MVKTFGVARSLGYGCYIGGVLLDLTLFNYTNPQTGQPFQSGIKTLCNIGVGALAIGIGGVPGIIFGGTYFLIDAAYGWERIFTPVTDPREFMSLPNGEPIYVCFKEGTLIHTNEGLKPIEKVVVGNIVYSYNLVKKTIELSHVVKSFKRKSEGIYEIKTTHQMIYVTAEHPFYVVDKGWVKVKDLHQGYMLKTKANSQEYILKTRIQKHQNAVYNIEVEGNHNYFVTESGILVHNK